MARDISSSSARANAQATQTAPSSTSEASADPQEWHDSLALIVISRFRRESEATLPVPAGSFEKAAQFGVDIRYVDDGLRDLVAEQRTEALAHAMDRDA